jgi:chemotaxis protein MotB
VLVLLAGCVSDEDRLRAQVRELRYDVAQGKQHNQDLKRRMRLVEARNRVLTSLVQGLTAEPAPVLASAGHPGAAQKEIGRAQASLQALDRDLEELVSTVHEARHDMHALRAQRKALEGELSRATRTIEQSQAQETAANERAVAYREMLLRFKAMMAAGNLKVHVVDNRMVLQLPETLLFDRGRAELKKNGRALLDEVAQVLIAVGDREFQIAGHTAAGRADAGSYESNWHLSAARAVLVTTYLIKKGVPKERLSAAAFADTRPAATGSLVDADRLNRRIEIVLLPRLDELPDLTTVDALLEASASADRPEPTPPDAQAPEPAAQSASEPPPTASPAPPAALAPIDAPAHATPEPGQPAATQPPPTQPSATPPGAPPSAVPPAAAIPPAASQPAP